MADPRPSDLGMLSLLLRVAPARAARRQMSSAGRQALLDLSDRLRLLEQGQTSAAPAEAVVAAWALDGLAGLLTTVEQLVGQFLGEAEERGDSGPIAALAELRLALLDERDSLADHPGAAYGRLAQIVEHLAGLLDLQGDEETGS